MIPFEAIEKDKNLFNKAVSQITPEVLGSVIDHTLLHPAAVRTDIERLCDEANSIGSFICVHGSRVKDARMFIRKKNLTFVRGIAAVVGFPSGAELIGEKKAGAWLAIHEEKANEVDMVLNIGKLIDEDYKAVSDDIFQVASAVNDGIHEGSSILKIIQENCCLSNSQKRTATLMTCRVGREMNIHVFAKTSTGFGIPKDEKTPKGATLEDVWLMAEIVERFKKEFGWPYIGIKASGGIGGAETAVKMMLAGGCFDDNIQLRRNLSDIFRIGTSSGKKIVLDFTNRFC